MANGRAQLDEWIARLRSLPVEIVAAAVPEVAEALLKDTKQSAADGIAPDGEAWPETKSGKPALPNAADRVSVDTQGSVVLLRLKGNEVRHHKGMARGRIRRQILPTRKIPDNVARAIKTVVGKHFSRIMGGE